MFLITDLASELAGALDTTTNPERKSEVHNRHCPAGGSIAYPKPGPCGCSPNRGQTLRITVQLGRHLDVAADER